jgi:HlyD family secretion protein
LNLATTKAAILLGISLAALPAAGCQKSSTDSIAGGPATAHGSDEQPVRIAAVRPQRKTLERHTDQPGQIMAQEETPIYAKIAGYVQSVPVDIGDELKQGQTLAMLLVPELNEEKKQKEALVAQAHAQVVQANSAVDVAHAAIETANAKVAAAKAAITKTDADVERWKSESARVEELAEKSAVTRKVADETRQQLRAAQAARQEADAQVRAAEALVNESTARLDAASADVKAANARVEVAQADLDRTTALLDYTLIKAPYNGVVTQRNVHTGHYVQPATTGRDQPLFVVAHTETVRAVVNVPEADAGFTNEGDPAKVRVQALDNKTFEAPVRRTAKSLDEATRTLRTEIELENRDGQLQPGMYCYVSIAVERRPDVLVIPQAAVMNDQGKAFAAAVVGGHIIRKPLVLGLRAGDEVEVVSGLAAEDVIAGRAPENYKEGQAVEIAK